MDPIFRKFKDGVIDDINLIQKYKKFNLEWIKLFPDKDWNWLYMHLILKIQTILQPCKIT